MLMLMCFLGPLEKPCIGCEGTAQKYSVRTYREGHQVGKSPSLQTSPVLWIADQEDVLQIYIVVELGAKGFGSGESGVRAQRSELVCEP